MKTSDDPFDKEIHSRNKKIQSRQERIEELAHIDNIVVNCRHIIYHVLLIVFSCSVIWSLIANDFVITKLLAKIITTLNQLNQLTAIFLLALASIGLMFEVLKLYSLNK
jgi:hypothetical protein